MNDAAALLIPLAVGLGLGALFFGGLWWTLGKAVASERSVLWLVGSFFVRTTLTLAGLYVVSDGQGLRILVCLLGFIMARAAVTRLVQSSKADTLPAPESRSAS